MNWGGEAVVDTDSVDTDNGLTSADVVQYTVGETADQRVGLAAEETAGQYEFYIGILHFDHSPGVTGDYSQFFPGQMAQDLRGGRAGIDQQGIALFDKLIDSLADQLFGSAVDLVLFGVEWFDAHSVAQNCTAVGSVEYTVLLQDIEIPPNGEFGHTEHLAQLGNLHYA